MILDASLILPKSHPEAERLKRLLTRPNPKYVDAEKRGFSTKNIPPVIKLFWEVGEEVHIPRYWYHELEPVVQKKVYDMRFLGDDVELGREVKLRDYQVQPTNTIVETLKEKGGVTLNALMGSGKCHGRDTPILMYDGTIRMVQHVRVGDELMGPDGKSRKVTSIARGREMMYEIIPEYGEYWTCNASHVLTLVHDNGDIVDISVEEYLKLSEEERKNLKLFFSAPDVWKKRYTPIDPYTLGFFLGEASYEKRPPAIPKEYVINDYQTRAAFLAGLIDACGVDCGKRGVRILLGYNTYTDQVVFIARSLGFRAEYKLDWPVDGADLKLASIFIQGRLDKLPLKTFSVQEPIEADLKTSFRVMPWKEENYYGFTLSPEPHYLLGDFCVTHNTVVSLAVAQRLKKKTLVLVHTEFLLNQWLERIKEFLGVEAGVIQGDECDVDKNIVVAMMQTLHARKEDYSHVFTNNFGLVITDESLPYESLIDTDIGQIPIGKIVEEKLQVRVKSFNHEKSKTAFKKILNYHVHAPKSPMLELMYECDNGEIKSFKCTANHPVYTENRGYVEAGNLTKEDIVILD